MGAGGHAFITVMGLPSVHVAKNKIIGFYLCHKPLMSVNNAATENQKYRLILFMLKLNIGSKAK